MQIHFHYTTSKRSLQFYRKQNWYTSGEYEIVPITLMEENHLTVFITDIGNALRFCRTLEFY